MKPFIKIAKDQFDNIKIAKNKLTNLFLPERVSQKPLKRSMSGYETEQFILDSKGNIDNSDVLFKKARDKGISVQKECAKSMIEMSCLPSKRLKTSSQSLLDNHIELNEIARKNDLFLFPFGTYFGKQEPIFRRNTWYTIKGKILTQEKWRYAGLCTGVHQHYALPRGIFDRKTRNIKQMNNSKVNKTLVDSYNFITAIDPILTLFAQSSPYMDGQYLGKDSRVIAYRGGSFLNYKQGLYSKHRLYGALSQYKSTVRDLVSAQKRRYEKFKILVKNAGYDPNKLMDKKEILRYNWTPVKINPHGTLEYRGYDMNYMSNVFSFSTLLKFSLREIQQNFKMVVPLDMDSSESFKVENNLIFIPPFSTVTKLQKLSAYKGLEDPDVYDYAKKFVSFAKTVTSNDYKNMLNPILKMLEEKQTVSDKIVSYFKKKGCRDKPDKKEINEAAIYFSEKYNKDLDIAKKMLHKAQD
jgi:hypothetical protein